MHISTFVFKCVNNIAPEMFKEYFVKLSHNYFTRRNGLDLLVPIVHTESARKGCFYSGAQAVSIIYHQTWKNLNPYEYLKRGLRIFYAINF